MRHLVALAATALMVAACEPIPIGDFGRPALPAPGEDTCGARQYAALIGQDATALERVLILRPVRVIRPGDAITMDFRPDRINFDLDEEDTIVRIWCG